MKIFANRKIKTLFCKILLYLSLFTLISVILTGFQFANAALYIFLCSLGMILTTLIICYRYFSEQNKIMEDAVNQITEYISGNLNARIECNDEGELYRLFHEVNSLVTILNAHTEKERKAKEFLKKTISDISHQLKTPLAALNIYNGILQSETENLPTIQKFTHLSELELDRIETLVQILLKITKFDAGIIIMDKKTENVSEMMKNIKKHFFFRIKEEEKEICLTGNDRILLSCDRDWLMEAIDNIVKNALDHTKKGDIIHISWKQSASIIQIIIKDNGSGIHPEDLHHIFKRFYRSQFSQDIPGIGLGLPLAKSIIEAHNGSIEVDSELGSGTTFVISFLIPTEL